jgi:hypothetical protein
LDAIEKIQRLVARNLIVATRNTQDYRRAGVEVINPWQDRPE